MPIMWNKKATWEKEALVELEAVLYAAALSELQSRQDSFQRLSGAFPIPQNAAIDFPAHKQTDGLFLDLLEGFFCSEIKNKS